MKDNDKPPVLVSNRKVNPLMNLRSTVKKITMIAKTVGFEKKVLKTFQPLPAKLFLSR